MELLDKYFTTVQWNGQTVHLPITQKFERWSALDYQGNPVPVANLVGCEWVSPMVGDYEDYELPLKFKVTMALPVGSAGELYYGYFGRPENLKLEGFVDGKLLLSFVARAACNVMDDRDWEPGAIQCGLKVAYEEEKGEEFHESDKVDLYDAHTCFGEIQDAIWLTYEVGQAVTLDENTDWILDEPETNEEIWSLNLTDAKKAFQWVGDDNLVDEVTMDGKTYRVVIVTHED